MEVLTEAVPRRGEMVAADTAWWELQDMLPEHALAVRFWGETTSLWWRWARDAVGETEVLARLHVPGGHTRTFLVHLAWGCPTAARARTRTDKSRTCLMTTQISQMKTSLGFWLASTSS